MTSDTQISPQILVQKIRLDSITDAQESEQLRHNWLKCLDAEPKGSLYLHPDLILPEKSQGRFAPIMIGVQRDGQDSGPIVSLSVLRTYQKKVALVPRLPLRLVVQGRKLAGSQILGSDDAESLRLQIGSFVEMLAAGETDQILFEDVEVGSALWEALERVRDRRVSVLYPLPPQPHWWINIPENPADYWQRFSAKTRNTLRRRAKKLEHTLIGYREKADVPLFLEKAHKISVTTWQSRRLGLRVRNSLEERQFWETVAAHGAFRSYILEHDGRPIAFVLGIQWRGCFVSEELGYDPAYAAFAPGNVLFFRILEDLIHQDTPARVDFGSGDNQYKQVFGNEQTMSGPVILARRALYPMAVLGLEQTRRKLSQLVRSSASRLGVLSRLRRLYRR